MVVRKISDSDFHMNTDAVFKSLCKKFANRQTGCGRHACKRPAKDLGERISQ